MTDVRLIQLSRIYGMRLESAAGARAVVAEHPDVLGEALFLEAVASDDVTSIGSARAYLADRLAELGDLVAEEASAAVWAAFEARLKSWE